MRDLTDAEQHVLDLLADVWSVGQNLPHVDAADSPALGRLIATAQNIILARPAVDQQNEDRSKGVIECDQRHRRISYSS